MKNNKNILILLLCLTIKKDFCAERKLSDYKPHELSNYLKFSPGGIFTQFFINSTSNLFSKNNISEFEKKKEREIKNLIKEKLNIEDDSLNEFYNNLANNNKDKIRNTYDYYNMKQKINEMANPKPIENLLSEEDQLKKIIAQETEIKNKIEDFLKSINLDSETIHFNLNYLFNESIRQDDPDKFLQEQFDLIKNKLNENNLAQAQIKYPFGNPQDPDEDKNLEKVIKASLEEHNEYTLNQQEKLLAQFNKQKIEDYTKKKSAIYDLIKNNFEKNHNDTFKEPYVFKDHEKRINNIYNFIINDSYYFNKDLRFIENYISDLVSEKFESNRSIIKKAEEKKRQEKNYKDLIEAQEKFNAKKKQNKTPGEEEESIFF